MEWDASRGASKATPQHGPAAEERLGHLSVPVAVDQGPGSGVFDDVCEFPGGETPVERNQGDLGFGRGAEGLEHFTPTLTQQGHRVAWLEPQSLPECCRETPGPLIEPREGPSPTGAHLFDRRSVRRDLCPARDEVVHG